MRRDKYKKPSNFHGLSGHELYRRWATILSRVTDPDFIDYPNYGGRGILICEEWREFPIFLEWALSAGYEKKFVIDRIDVDGHYCPENCRWIDRSKSSFNKRKRDDFGIQYSYKKYYITIVRHNVHYYLGAFNSLQEAKDVRDTFLLSLEYGWELEYVSKNNYLKNN
jgi:hypothetical protein